MNILEFAFRYLFDELGVKRAYWTPLSGEDQYRPGCAGGLRLTSRDMAKYGLLYLRNGRWNDKQLVSEDWVRESVEGKMDSGDDTRYGYFWKRTHSLDGRHDIFFASGTGGQYIACIPELEAVVVTTAAFNTDKADAIALLLLTEFLPMLTGQHDHAGSA